jgi:hypothetical protein
MPASGKMLKNKAQKANREAGVGDAQGRMPSRVKATEVMGRCTKCFTEIRMTKTNTEGKAHVEGKHAGMTFAECFPGQFDPTAAAAPEAVDASTLAAAAPAVAAAAPKKKKKSDLSFLDASL